ncbi:MAG: hypothetical protein ABIJ91_04180 [Candidatus Kuenenbacteria bacterium]
MPYTSLQTNIPIIYLREKSKFIAYSPTLDLSTCGDTYKQAQERFSEAVEIFFEEIAEKKIMSRVLQDLGWHKKQKEWQSPVLISQERKTVKIPA